MIRHATRLQTVDPEQARLVASRHPAARVLTRALESASGDLDQALVALSGGPDSVALLLLCLAAVRRRSGGRLAQVTAIHVDHALRAESHEESVFVAELARRFEVPCRVTRLSWPDRPDRPGSDAVRTARWSALQDAARSIGATAILTAHHADDQAETVLLRAARGTGPDGLCGIPPERVLAPGLHAIRPLLACRRRDLAALVEAAGVPWIDDPTNHRTDGARERIRHEVIPALEAIHPQATLHLAGLAESMRAGPGPAPVRAEANLVLFDREDCREATPAALATALRSAALELVGAEAATVTRATWHSAARAGGDEDPRPRRVRITDAVELRSDRDGIRLVRLDPTSSPFTARASPEPDSIQP